MDNLFHPEPLAPQNRFCMKYAMFFCALMSAALFSCEEKVTEDSSEKIEYLSYNEAKGLLRNGDTVNAIITDVYGTSLDGRLVTMDHEYWTYEGGESGDGDIRRVIVVIKWPAGTLLCSENENEEEIASGQEHPVLGAHALFTQATDGSTREMQWWGTFSPKLSVVAIDSIGAFTIEFVKRK